MLKNILISLGFLRMLWVAVMWAACFGLAEADGGGEVRVEVGIYDSLTGRQVLFPMISVFRFDEAESDSTKVTIKPEMTPEGCLTEFGMPREKGTYMLLYTGTNERMASFFSDDIQRRVKSQGKFATAELYFEVTDESPDRIVLPRLTLTRGSLQRKLKDVDVTASKVMFYHKGDTLVYNADAFVLAEGSMLDALLRQMPGVELKSNGLITVNGKKVDNLLINGKDLFNGRNQLMLENLAAYTVKDIAVYTRTGARSELTGMNMGDNRYVMDVRLKREYSIGWMLNADGAYGTHSRYAAKLFGTWFAENAAMTAHFNTNNLNDASTPGAADSSGYDPAMMKENEKRVHKGGITYMVGGSADRWELKGDVNAGKEITDRRLSQWMQNYFDGGDSYRYSWMHMHNDAWNINTRHELRLKLSDKVLLHVKPAAGYGKRTGEGSSVSAMLNAPVDGITHQSVAADMLPEELKGVLVNRRRQLQLERGHNVWAEAEALSDIVLGSRTDILTISARGVMRHSVNNRFNRFRIDFGNAPGTIPIDEYQYFKEHPDHNREGAGGAEYRHVFNRHITFKLNYLFTRTEQVQTSYLYQLDAIGSELPPFGVLPSAAEYASHINAAQSHQTHYSSNLHRGTPSLEFNSTMKGQNVSFSLSVPVDVTGRRLDYDRPGMQPMQVRSSEALPQISANLNFSLSSLIHFSFVFNSEAKLQNMMAMVDITDTTDPLRTVTGNPSLRPSRLNMLMGYMTTSSKNYVTSNTVMFQGHMMSDAVAYGTVYDPLTGVMHSKAYNVDGNRNFLVTHNVRTGFGKHRRFTFEAATKLGYERSVDLAGAATTAMDLMPPKRRIDSYSADETLNIDWHTGQLHVGAVVNAQFRRYTGRDPGFTDFSAWNTRCGTHGVLNLPRNWNVSTDLNLYTRRGYSDSALNTSDVVWNARVSKSVLKGALVFAIDGYDMLQQLSNISYTINAQARTETVSNVIPSYLLFHICYRFNRNPGKK